MSSWCRAPRRARPDRLLQSVWPRRPGPAGRRRAVVRSASRRDDARAISQRTSRGAARRRHPRHDRRRLGRRPRSRRSRRSKPRGMTLAFWKIAMRPGKPLHVRPPRHDARPRPARQPRLGAGLQRACSSCRCSIALGGAQRSRRPARRRAVARARARRQRPAPALHARQARARRRRPAARHGAALAGHLRCSPRSPSPTPPRPPPDAPPAPAGDTVRDPPPRLLSAAEVVPRILRNIARTAIGTFMICPCAARTMAAFGTEAQC